MVRKVVGPPMTASNMLRIDRETGALCLGDLPPLVAGMSEALALEYVKDLAPTREREISAV